MVYFATTLRFRLQPKADRGHSAKQVTQTLQSQTPYVQPIGDENVAQGVFDNMVCGGRIGAIAEVAAELLLWLTQENEHFTYVGFRVQAALSCKLNLVQR